MATGAVFGRWQARTLALLATLFLTIFNSAAGAAECGAGFVAGRHEVSILSGGVERSAVYFVPSSYDGKRKVPLVFDFHGSNSNPRAQMNRSHWDEVAEREGFMVMALEGSLEGSFKGGHAWNVPGVVPLPGVNPDNGLDESAFIRDAVTFAKDNFCIDDARVFATGYSGGGRMLSQFICNGNGEFTAAGFMMGLRAGFPEQEEGGTWRPRADTCKPAKPISIIAFSGLKDDVNPFAGGGKPYWQYGGEVAVGRWAELNGCDRKPMHHDGAQASVSIYGGCKDGAVVMSFVVPEAGHAWLGSSVRFELAAAGDQPMREVDATAGIWEFFKNSGIGLMAGSPVGDDESSHP